MLYDFKPDYVLHVLSRDVLHIHILAHFLHVNCFYFSSDLLSLSGSIHISACISHFFSLEPGLEMSKFSNKASLLWCKVVVV